MITIHDSPAERTPMRPLSKRLGNGVAAHATIDARILGGNPYHPAPSFFRFVCSVVEELAPPSVAYALSQTMILDHASDIQIFDGDKPEAVYNVSGNLMMEIGTLISDSTMESSQEELRPSPILRSLFLLRKLAVSGSEFLLGNPEMLRVNDGRIVGEDGEGLDPQIDAYRSGGNRSGDRSKVNREAGIPLACFPLNRASFNLTNDRAVEFNFNRPNLGKPESVVRQLKSRFLGIGDGVVAILILESRIASLARLSLNPSEESLVSSIHTEKNVLQYLGMDFSEGVHPLLIGLENYLLINPRQTLAGFFVPPVPIQQAGIVKRSTNIQRPTQSSNLIPGGGQPIFIGFSHFDFPHTASSLPVSPARQMPGNMTDSKNDPSIIFSLLPGTPGKSIGRKPISNYSPASRWECGVFPRTGCGYDQ